MKYFLREKKNFTGKAERGEKGRKSRQKIGGLNRIFLREKNFTGKAECGKKGRKSQQKIGGVNRIFLREKNFTGKPERESTSIFFAPNL